MYTDTIHTRTEKRLRHRRGFSLVELVVTITVVGVIAAISFAGGGRLVNDARTSRTTRELEHFEAAVTSALYDHPEAGTYANNNLTGKLSVLIKAINENLETDEKIENPTVALTESDGSGRISISADVADTGAYAILASGKKDPWGNPYYFIFDTSNRQARSSQFHVTVISAGPNASAEIGGRIDRDDLFLLDEQLNGRVYSAIYNCAELDGFDIYDNDYVLKLAGSSEALEEDIARYTDSTGRSTPSANAKVSAPAKSSTNNSNSGELLDPELSLTRTEGQTSVGESIVFNVDRQGTGAIGVVSANSAIARARLSGSIITITGVSTGTTTIAVQCAETKAYRSGIATFTVTVVSEKDDQTVSLAANTGKAFVNITKEFTVIHESSGTVSAISDDPSIAAVVDVTDNIIRITGVSVGSTTISIVADGDEDYNEGSTTLNITVEALRPIAYCYIDDNVLYFDRAESEEEIPDGGSVVPENARYYVSGYAYQGNLVTSAPWEEERGSITRVVFNDEITSVRPAWWFANCTSLVAVDNISKLKVDNADSFKEMFGYCSSLESIDLSRWNAPRATSISLMFEYCTNLQTITGLECFTSNNITEIWGFARNCEALEVLEGYENWDVQNVSNMNFLFHNCLNLKNIVVSGWNTQAMDRMAYAFAATGIKELDLSTWDTSHVQACNFEFNGCLDLEVIYVGAGWDMEKVTNSTGMFGSCFKLRNFNGSIIDKTNAHTGDGGYLTYKS